MDIIKSSVWRWNSLNQLMVLCYLILGLNVVQIFAAEDYQTNLRALDCQDAYGRPQVTYFFIEYIRIEIRFMSMVMIIL